ncbi:uro-adherence factor A isoform X2 [Cherax quadricarinatus]
MACTLLRIVQAAVNLRRRFECAIQSSFDSVESGDVAEERDEQANTEENGHAQPGEEDMNTSEQLSQNFQLSFAEEDEEIENIGEPIQTKTVDLTKPKMTFINFEETGDDGNIENEAYRDAITSSSIEIIEENAFFPLTKESGSEAQTKEYSFTDTESTTHVREDIQPAAIQKIPLVQVNEISGSDRSSDSDSDSRCSVKSVRLRYADAVSPSSGCKPAKLIRSDALETNAEKESNNLQWILLVKESGSELVKESDKENGDSTTESEIDKTELMGYSDWLLKGKESLEVGTSSDENDVESPGTEGDDEVEDEEEVEEGEEEEEEGEEEEEEDEENYDSEDYLEDDDELMADASFDDSFVDDGFVSLELDEYDNDVIIEENEEDLERERMEEEVMEEMRRYWQERGGRGEQTEHRKLSRQYSPALYLPGIPETKVVLEAKEEGGGSGRLRYTSSYRSGRGSKRSLRSPPVQRQRCVQLEGGEGEEEGAGATQGRAAPRPHPPTPDHRPDSRDIVLEVDPIRVTTGSASSEVPLIVVATAEGGTRTHALNRTRSRPTHPPTYTHSASPGDPLPTTHTYHKYGSASFDLAKPSRYEGARAAFHTSRSSFEGDRRLSMSTAGGRGGCESALPPPACDKSPGSARRLACMEAGSRPCSSSSNSDRTLKESVPRAGFRRSRSERVGGSSAGASPARSESLRVGRSRKHHQDVEMTELCTPRRLHSYDEYSSRLSTESSVTPAGVSGGVEGAGVARYSSWRTMGMAGRRQSSLDSSELEDIMEKRRQLEQRRLLLQADSTTPSDEDEEPRSKVRYNDTGSLEQVNEEMADLLEDSSTSATSSENLEKIKVQCRALWQLRTTLEEEDPEDPDSDSGRMEVYSSPDHHSPGRTSDLENVTSATSHTTSFESNTDAVVGGETGVGVEAEEGEEAEVEVEEQEVQERDQEPEPPQTRLTLPSSEARRTSYRAILANRLKHLDASTRPPLSSENSFDSVDTECSSTTDLSRPEGLTTSFDSTTDCPTDSTSDTHSHRLQQMKSDSGYRSLEVNNSRPPKLSKKQIHFVEDSLEAQEIDMERDRSRERHRDPDFLFGSQDSIGDPQSKRERLRKSVAQFERRWGKTHAKKRREALRERHASLDTILGGSMGSSFIGVGGSLEADATTTDEISGKRSVLARFLHTHRYPAAHYRLLQRDYSIDEKSDRLFKEFSRTEIPLEWEPVSRRCSRLYTGRRLHRHLDAESSPRSHRRKLSPQDSIEEEDQVAAALWAGEVSRPESLAGSIGGEDIPAFALTEEAE